MYKLTKLGEKQAATIVAEVVHTTGCRNKAEKFARLIDEVVVADNYGGKVRRGDDIYRTVVRNFGTARHRDDRLALCYEGRFVRETDDGAIQTSEHPRGIYRGFAVSRGAAEQLEEIATEIASQSNERVDLIFQE